MFLQYLLNCGIVTVRSDYDTGGAADGFGDEGGNGVCSFSLDQLFELPNKAPDKLCFRFVILLSVIVVRGGNAQDPEGISWHIKVRVHDRQACQRRCSHGDTVIGALQRNDFFLLRFACHVEVIAKHLDLRVIGFAARIREKHFGVVHRHHLAQLVGQIHSDLMGTSAKHMAVGQGAKLLGNRFDHLFIAVAERSTPKGRQTLEVLLALFVVHIDAIAADDVQLLNLREIGSGIYKCSHSGRIKQHTA